MSESVSVPTHPIAPRLKNGPKEPHVGPHIHAYRSIHQQTLGHESDKWWAKMARETISWDRPFHTVRAGSFENGDIVWFPEGGLNASYNCVDRWAFKHPDKTAIIYEADEPGEGCDITYAELLREVCGVANVLKELGVKKGDTVSVYLPMTWHAVAAFLACARIGAIHSVVFAGFSAESLRDRVQDCKSRVLITSDEGRRGGKTIATKLIADAAVKECPSVEHVLVLRRTGNDVPFTPGRDKWWHEEIAKVPSYCPPEVMSSEDPLFILYTSGSTGRPKGVVHTTGGYLLCAALTVKYVFDVHPDDRFACMADIGWITGHTYIVYGPLMNGVSTMVFESTPVYPTPSRYWQTVDKHQLTQFYSAPTAIRLLRRLGDHHVKEHDLGSLRVLGSVGEPINPEAWHWYNEHVGRGQCAIVDTFWQTETGSIVVTPFPGAIETKPGAATVPFFGIEPAILDPVTGKEIEGEGVEGVLVLKTPWPSIARTVYQDHKRYLETYMKPYPGVFYTGDGAARDEHGYIWIKGRVDDVINVSGHRLSTAEIESALITHTGVAETAAVGVADELTGQAVYSFVTLKPEFSFDHNDEAALLKELTLQVRKVIGPFAAPKKIYLVPDLPKTRSGKIMRRVLRKIVAGEADQLGDLSTLADPSIVEVIKSKVASA
ncbi:acetyl-coenzyme a synthetase [Laetiporus sulphureus 93-53]|uniref:Acetyl-coenzyme A synthetase n=1 Tax=Laetiporus sulphureus 93-53 TaxID=1314785 RepID=A0A165F085_9APHY|nr:acetyl-coenzyme a synthetase [Laetiporus sulphureus 93-53]KZT08091.1 acetyl-coenzyme a synthetase [Laetiporus sulphureus 93-53]